MRRKLRLALYRALQWLQPKPDLAPTVRYMSERLAELSMRDDTGMRQHMERVCELQEALQMAGSGPWTVGPAVRQETEKMLESARTAWNMHLRETSLSAQGAFGDLELALANVEWQRQIQLSWLEFTRYGISQIMLISRLNYIKNPIIRRLIDVCASYVFARGVEVSATDEKANEILRDFFDRNQRTLGQGALVELEKRKDYDGNIFFVLFPDDKDTGKVDVRTIDATEINEIESDPEDSDTPWFYKRVWTQKIFNVQTGGTSQSPPRTAYYPALGYEADLPESIGGVPVMRNSRVYHRKCGGVSKWTFGCPRIYPALDWAKEARKYLEACCSTAQSLAQFAMTLTTKGGQQALGGAKSQLQTTVGPSGFLWDQNPPAVAGATFASGPGTKIEAFKQNGGQDPEKVRQLKLMCCMVKGVPETFLGDVSTGNLATATSLDRPTETVMIALQEEWREDLLVISKFVLETSLGAISGKLRESYGERAATIRVRECARKRLPSGRWVYAEEAKKFAGPNEDGLDTNDIGLKVDFPAIREGDQKLQMEALAIGATMNNKAGQFIGLDEKETVRKAAQICDIDGYDEILEEQYPSKPGKDAAGNKYEAYDPNRLTEILPAPIQKLKPPAGGQPQLAPDQVPDARGEIDPDAKKVQESIARLKVALRVHEASKPNGHA